MVIFAILRPRLSPTVRARSSTSSNWFTSFVKGQAEDQVGHAAHRYLAFFGTIFLFILTCEPDRPDSVRSNRPP